MASQFLKVGVIARAAIALLIRDLVIARTVWNDAVAGSEFTGSLNDTVTIRVPAMGQPARTRAMRSATPITNDDLLEFGVDVKLDTDVYKGVKTIDEDLTLSIRDFATQILRPQTQAVAEKVEDLLAATMGGATYATEETIDEADPYVSFVAARKALNDAKVPKNGRTLLVGSDVEAAILTSDRLTKFDQGPGLDALTDARIGRMAGFDVVGSSAIDGNAAYAYHRSAFVLATRAPAVPDGAAMGEAIAFEGLALRWLRDYDYVNVADRSLVNVYYGDAVVEDADDPTDPTPTTSLVRAVKLAIAS